VGALFGVAGLVALAPQNLPRLDSVFDQYSVLAFAFLLSTAVAAGLGAFTAARATSGDRARASRKVVADKPVRKAASALAG